MKNFLALESGLPSINIIKITYYLLQVISISACITFILDGIADPFGELTIIIGAIALVLVPMCFRILFGLILEMVKNRNKN